jgi:hypothetical protein
MKKGTGEGLARPRETQGEGKTDIQARTERHAQKKGKGHP